MMKDKLAIFGGQPVREAPMPQRVAFSDSEADSVQEMIQFYREKDLDPPYQGEFEQRFCADYVQHMGGEGYATAIATGTGSVYVALAALDLPKGGEVIISPVTDSGPLNAIIMLGLIPVVADSAPSSYNMGVAQFLDKVTEKTVGLLAVHAAGEPLAIDQIVKEAHDRGIKVLEDCSQAPGAKCNGGVVGSFGDIAATSTMYRKSLNTAGSGGIVYTRDADAFHLALAHKDRGKQIWRTDINLNDPGHALFPALNLNSNEFSCAVGIASLARLEETISGRNAFLKELVERIESDTELCSSYYYDDNFSPFYFPIFVDVNGIDCTKTEFAESVAAEGIGLLPHYGCLVGCWEWAHEYLSGEIATPNACDTRDRSFNLYVNEKYTGKEVDDVIQAIKKVEAHYLSQKQR